MNAQLPTVRRIVHVDMDAFYASVEQRDDPSLRGKPVAVGGQPQSRGVVAAASYEARAFGVHSAMSMAKAVRLCPTLVIVRPDFARYKAVSHAVFSIFREVTPLVEPLSLDEAYLDVTENAWGEPLGTTVARRLKERIRVETGLTASAGVAPNKFLAKIASGWKKPDGLTVIGPERVEPFLQQLPVDALWGVGPVTAKKLRDRGIEKLVDVRTADVQLLRDTVGSMADWLRQLARGLDDRPVVPNREAKSSGSETTYPEDLMDLDTIRAEIAEMASHAIAWLARKDLLARTVTIKVRYGDFTTVTRSHTAPATRDEAELTARAVRLLDKTDAGRRPIRLLGASLHNFTTTAGNSWLPFETEDLISSNSPAMLKGTRDGILKKVQPVSIHGQVSWDVFFTDVDDPDGQVNVARIGPEAVIGNNLEPGDRIQVEYLVGVPVKVTRVVPAPEAR